jgi:hypothetical protein
MEEYSHVVRIDRAKNRAHFVGHFGSNSWDIESRVNYHWISFGFSSFFRAFMQQTSSHPLLHHERTIMKRTKEKPKGAATMTTFQCKMSSQALRRRRARFQTMLV